MKPRTTRVVVCRECGVSFSPRCSTACFCSKACSDVGRAERRRGYVAAHRARDVAIHGRWRDSGPKAASLKAWMVKIKSKPCTDCGGTFPVCCMDFDHKDGTTKSYNVGCMFAHHYSRALIEQELEKCELVCSNCHRIRTRDRRTGSKVNNKQGDSV